PVLAAAALRALGDADPARAIVAACSLVSHSQPAIACAAVEAVGYFAARAAVRTSTSSMAACEEALFSALHHSHDDVVKLALPLLGAQTDARSLARMGLCLDHPSWEVRRLAAELLGHDKRAGAQGLLRARYDREKDLVVREAIKAAVSVHSLDPPRRENREESESSVGATPAPRRREGR
ncbi:MAG: HEAT repeat domain-containing protein, partial [Myxococcota bacterium]|nr:HEAT repeat domain-containing protein [Myxococcota bacterium]